MKETFFKLRKLYGITGLVIVFVLSIGISGAIAALTFNDTRVTSDSTLVVDASSTIAVGNTDGTIITIGRSGQTVRFPGAISSSIIDASGIMDIGSSTATTITIGRSGQGVRFPGAISSTAIDFSGIMDIGSSTATIITIGRSGQTVRFPGAISSSIIDASGSMDIGTSTATEIRIGRAGQTVRLLGNASTTGTFTISATGTAIIAHLSATSSIGFGALLAVTCQDTPITVTGAVVGDTVVVGPPAVGTSSLPAGLGWYAYVSSTDVVAIRGCNNLGSSTITAVSSTWRVDVWKH